MKNEPERGATLPATQVGLRPVEAGLGGHDDGASGVDDGVEISSLPYCKRGRSAQSDCPTFSDYVGADNQFVSEMQSCVDGSCLHQHILCCLVLSSGLPAADFIINDHFL